MYKPVTDSTAVGSEANKLNLFSDIVSCMNDDGISFAIINGFNPSTRELGRDVDILINSTQVSQIVTICKKSAAKNGWQYVSGRWVGHWLPRGLYQIVFHHVENHTIHNLVIDFICTDGVAAGVVSVYTRSLLSADSGFSSDFRVTPVGNYMKNLIRVLAGDSLKIANAEALGDLPDGTKAYMTSLLGGAFSSRYEQTVKKKRLSAEWQMLRRHAQLSYSLHHPVSFLRNFGVSLARRSIGWRLGHVTTIAIVGPDGVGKSTAIDEACRYLADAFITIRRRHWRPRLLPNLSEIGLAKSSRTSAALEREFTNAPRRQAGRFGILRLLYYYVDYVLGHAVKDRLYSTPDILVNLYDRCALDMAVDPVRYGLNQNKLTPWLHRLSPKPDRIIFLSDAPERVFARKPELSRDEIAHQIEAWTVLAEKGHVTDIIHVEERNAKEIGCAIAKIILEQVSHIQGQHEALAAPFPGRLSRTSKE